MNMQLPAAVLWDMDGTLIDTEPYWMAAETELVERFGGTWSHQDGLAMVGNPLDVSAQILRERTPVDLPIRAIVEELQSGVIEAMRKEMPWRPGARELLLALREADVPCALVTMSWRPMAQVLLAALPRDTFGAVVTGDEVTVGKPDPEAYLTGAAQLGVAIGDCVAIEDSPSGVRSALASGARTLGIPHMVELPELAGLFRVDSLERVQPGDLLALTTA
ncbi:HAD family hydrolase [Gephyromycinifex aptenodytis]|uniref:HAD family hydrolase n=1 Tax=Gephyromycinifex aptenodytis TaxID=2716227 RepID=UPI001446B5E6|nr:HAD family phosphatase [Gephyromycinifex aptenodytis]